MSIRKSGRHDPQDDNQKLEPELGVHCVALLGQRILSPPAPLPTGGVAGQAAYPMAFICRKVIFFLNHGKGWYAPYLSIRKADFGNH